MKDETKIIDKSWVECCSAETEKLFGKEDEHSAKADSGKPNLSLVPTEIIYEIEKVRSFGVEKYHDPALAIWDDMCARDVESGLLHLSHIATNVAFMLELLKDGE